MTNRPRFFVLRPARSGDRSFASTDDAAMKAETLQCDRFSSVSLRRLTPLVLRSLPAIQDDFIWSWYHDLIATENGKEHMSAARLSGYGFAEAFVSRLRDVSAGRDRLWEVCVTGFGGFARPTGLSPREWCCEHEAISFDVGATLTELLDETKWDGSDVFTIWPYPIIRICTARFADALDSARLTGIRCVPIDEFQFGSRTAAPGIPAAELSDEAVFRLERDPDYVNFVRNICGSEALVVPN